MNSIYLTSLLVAICSIICWMGGTGAAVASERNLSFSEAVTFALKNNHEIKALKNAASATEEGVGIARSFLLPRLIFEERYLRTVNPGYAFMTKLNQQRIEQSDFNPNYLNNPEPIDDFQTSLFVEQPLFTRKGCLGLEMSQANSRAKNEEVHRKQEEIAFQVSQAVISMQTAQVFLGVAEKSVEEAREHLRITELRHKNGLGQYSDTLRASTSLTEAEQRRVSAAKNLSVAKRGLGLILGLEENVTISDKTPDIPLRNLADYKQAGLSRRDLRSGEIRGENARKNIKMAEAGYFPYVGIGGGYQLNDHNKPLGTEGNNWQVTAFLRWDLFDGAKREYERSKARYEAVSAQEQLLNLRKAITFRIYEAYLSIEEVRKNTELAGRGLKSAEEGKRLVRVRYENGLYPLIDLLNAQVSLDQARANVAAREGEQRLAKIRLSFESGTILQDLKIEP